MAAPSTEQLQELRETFDMFDKNKDGGICRDELKTMMMQFSHHEPSAEELDAIMRSADTNCNDRIEFDEFVAIMMKCTQEEQLEHAFAMMDKDGDGTISSEELKEVMKRMGENVSTDDIDEMIREIDLNGDGQIDYHEFVKVMMEKKEET